VKKIGKKDILSYFIQMVTFRIMSSAAITKIVVIKGRVIK